MEVENITSKKKSGGILTFFLGFLSVLILFGTLGGVAYYYFVIKDGGENPFSLDEKRTSNKDLAGGKEINRLVEQIKDRESRIKVLAEENALLKSQSRPEMVQRLGDVVKPKSEVLIACHNAKLGEWKAPANCLKDLKANLSKMIQSDKKIVVLEVAGIVDEKQYTGRHPELKQEGLASFRAKEVMMQLRQDFGSVLTFQGMSAQERMKRGFFVRAYYVQ